MSNKFTLNRTDVEKWVYNTLIFSSPAILAFLMALQTHASLSFAIGAAYSALLSAGIDLTRKFIGGK